MDRILNAAYIKCAVANPQFTDVWALWCAGIDIQKASEDETLGEYCRRVNTATKAIYASGDIEFSGTIPNMIERCKILVSHAVQVPKKIHKNGMPLDPREAIGGVVLADYCRLAGFPEKLLDSAAKSKPEYQQIFLFKSLLRNEKIPPLKKTTKSHQRYDQRPLQILVPGIPQTGNSQVAQDALALNGSVEAIGLLSPTSRGSQTRFSVSSVIVETVNDAEVESSIADTLDTSLSLSGASAAAPTATTATTDRISHASSWQMSGENTTADKSSALLSYSSRSNQNAFSKKVNTNGMRRTAKQACEDRKNEIAWKQTRDTAYCIGTILYQRVKEKTCPLLKFKSAEACAKFVNDGFECVTVSGRELQTGVARGIVGKPPPVRKGRKSETPEEDIAELRNLLFTANTIDQVNCDPLRMKVPTQISVIGSILNNKREAEGSHPLDDVNFFRRHIAKKLDQDSEVSFTDKRELLRSLWLTYEQQKKHYVNWEKHLIDLGFGRAPDDDKERSEHGNVVFHEGQLGRMFHIDEMGFSFDGAKNGIGGRVASNYSNPLFPEAGQASAKSSDKISILFGATYSKEPLPPLIVFPNAAKSPKIELKLLQSLHQIKGKFGYSKERTFNCVIGKLLLKVACISLSFFFLNHL